MHKGYQSLIVLMGLPSAGKSTIASLLSGALKARIDAFITIIGTDTMRRVENSKSNQFDPTLEPFIKTETLKKIQKHLRDGEIVINDDMNYYKSMRHDLKQIAEQNRAHFILIHLQVPLQTALDWNTKRGLPIPQEVIIRVHERFDSPGDYKWDTPLVTIQSNQEVPADAVDKIVSLLLPVITAPPERKTQAHRTRPGWKEQVDKLTRDIVAKFAILIKDPLVLKKVSALRKNFIKNLPEDTPLDRVESKFKHKLETLLS
jgi:tRNA uridine 5-carbamoylmethylation protein Kti12